MLPLQQLPLENWRPHKNITLIGDAAHGMPPYAGVGLNTGLLDALYLAENLTGEKFNNLQAAINNYEEKMFACASAAQQQPLPTKNSFFSEVYTVPVERQNIKRHIYNLRQNSLNAHLIILLQ